MRSIKPSKDPDSRAMGISSFVAAYTRAASSQVNKIVYAFITNSLLIY
jgi:hypothetical protein